MVVKPLEPVEINRLEGEFGGARPQSLVTSAANLMSQLTHFAGVVLTPRREGGFRHLEFLRLSDRRVLLIIVTSEGDVQNRILHSDRAYSQAQLTEASNYFNQQFAGQPFTVIRERLAADLARLRDDIAHLMTAAVDAGEDATSGGDDVVVAGERNLLTTEDFVSNMSRLRRLFDMFEERSSLLHLLDVSQRAQGVQIYIGGESGLEPLDEMSVVTAPYEVNGRVVGTLGVIGPTRMAYERVIPIVELTSKLLSSALAHQIGDE
jgi:heat-inducible transcriptional repressor